MIRSLAVTTDFSDLSRLAFGLAGDLARHWRAPLYAVHVVESEPIYVPWQVVQETPSRARCEASLPWLRSLRRRVWPASAAAATPAGA